MYILSSDLTCPESAQIQFSILFYFYLICNQCGLDSISWKYVFFFFDNLIFNAYVTSSKYILGPLQVYAMRLIFQSALFNLSVR